MSSADSFVHHFAEACREVLAERARTIVDLRFGIAGGMPLTLQAVGMKCGISRERVRQIINKALSRIRVRGIVQIKKGERHTPCAQLITYLDGALEPGRSGVYERIRRFVAHELASLSFSSIYNELLVSLLFFKPPAHGS